MIIQSALILRYPWFYYSLIVLSVALLHCLFAFHLILHRLFTVKLTIYKCTRQTNRNRSIYTVNLPGESIIYSALIGRPFCPVEIGEFLQKAPFENLQKPVKHQARFPFVLLPSSSDSWMCSCTLSSGENGIPLNKLLTPGGRLSTRQKESIGHGCEVNTSGILACNFSTFFKVSQRSSF